MDFTVNALADGRVQAIFHIEGEDANGHLWKLDDAIVATQAQWDAWTDGEKQDICEGRLMSNITVWTTRAAPVFINVTLGEVTGMFAVGEIVTSSDGATGIVQAAALYDPHLLLTLNSPQGTFPLNSLLTGSLSLSTGTIVEGV